MEELKNDTRTLIVYEAPHHLLGTLKELQNALGDRRLTVCRELTKKFETAFQTTFSEAISYYEEQGVRGECVLVIEGRSGKNWCRSSSNPGRQFLWKNIWSAT